MRTAGIIFVLTLIASGAGMLATAGDRLEAREPATPPAGEAGAVAEARLRSRLLHETIHGSLQVMHRDFFRDEGKQIPSASLEDVFTELEKTWRVKVKWLVVNAKVMNIKHRPETAFEKRAAEAIADGSEMFEASADGVYQYAGKVVLGNQCLKCHVPLRTSLEDRKAAVVISMPLKLTEPAAKK